jgi:S-adenosylmethionine-dependent methyltransferase
LAFANLQDFLPLQAKPSLCALDLGCGTGATAVRLARLGINVTLLDSSPAMLDMAKSAAREAGISGKIVLKLGDAAELTNLFPAGSFDVILCHNVLEYLDDPIAVLCGAARALRDSSAILSILVRNRAGEVFKAAIQAGDLAVAENNLTAEWGQESLYGGRVRLFTSYSLHAMLVTA